MARETREARLAETIRGGKDRAAQLLNALPLAVGDVRQKLLDDASLLNALVAELEVVTARVTELETALNFLRAEVSRWVYLDATPDDPDNPEDWRGLATGRAEYVLHITSRALAASSPNSTEGAA